MSTLTTVVWRSTETHLEADPGLLNGNRAKAVSQPVKLHIRLKNTTSRFSPDVRVCLRTVRIRLDIVSE